MSCLVTLANIFKIMADVFVKITVVGNNALIFFYTATILAARMLEYVHKTVTDLKKGYSRGDKIKIIMWLVKFMLSGLLS